MSALRRERRKVAPMLSVPCGPRGSPAIPALLDYSNSPHWVHAAVAVEHPDVHVLRLLCARRPCDPCEGVWRFYTDGSCNVPQCLDARNAAWAVVVDAAQAVPTEVLLAAFLRSGRALPAFHVMAQGLCPGTQNIGRAEVCALLQVCHVARKFPQVLCEVWSDSAYAIQFLELLKPSALRLPSTDLDLCAWSSVWECLPNVRLFKVESHQELDWPVTANTRAMLGNAVADGAAKAAQALNLPYVLQLVDEVKHHFITQRDMLQAYLFYQAELTKLFAKLRKQQDAQSQILPVPDSASRRVQWFSLNGPASPQPATVEVPDEVLLIAPWPPWFTLAVRKWTLLLKWPEAKERCNRTDGIANVELLANFVATTGELPPIHVAGRKTTDLHPCSPEGITVPFILKDAIMTLLAAVRFLDNKLGWKSFQGKRHHKVRCLEVLGIATPKRPVWWQPW